MTHVRHSLYPGHFIPTKKTDMRTTSTPEKVITIYGTNLGETGKAVRFSISRVGTEGTTLDNEKVEWFPFSQIRKHFKDPNSTGKDYLIVTQWICDQKGLLK